MKCKSNRLFSLSLFAESLRQMRLMGFVYLMLCVIFAVLPAILSGGSNFYPLSTLDNAPVLLVFQYVAPITMGFSLFGYLTKRNASDFYHSLPVSRECAYFSRVAALAVYLLGTIMITVPASAIAYSGMGRIVIPGQIPWLISFYFLSSLLVLGSTLVGLASTGTLFSAFIVAGLMMFLPGYLSYMVHALAQEVTTIVYPETLSPLLNLQLNLPVGQFITFFMGNTGIFTGGSEIPYLTYLPAHLTTLGLALLYIVLGAVIHHCRRSEIAKSSAPNRFLQHLYRCLIASPIFLMLGAMIAMDDIDGETFLWLGVIGLLVYFLYEIFTTRKVRNLWGALKVLPLVLILSFVLPLTGTLIGNAAEAKLPARDRIESVTLNFDQRYADRTTYNMLELCEYEYTDEALIDALYGSLEDTVAIYKDKRKNETAAIVPATVIGEMWDATMTEANPYSTPTESYRWVDTQFNMKNGQTFIRKVRVLEKDWDAIWELRKQDEGFRTAVAKLPETEQIVGMRLGGIYLDTDTYKNSVVDERLSLAAIWETFREEYAQLDAEQQLVVCNFSDASVNAEYYTTEMAAPVPMDYTTSAIHYSSVYGGTTWYDLPTEMTITGIDGAQSFRDHYTITSLTPETLKLVIEYINTYALYETKGELPMNYVRKVIAEADENAEYYLYANLHLYDPEAASCATAVLEKNIYPENFLLDPKIQEDFKMYPATYVTHEYLTTLDEIMSLMQTGSTASIDLTKPFVYIASLNLQNYSTGMGWGSSPLFLQLDRAEYDKLVELLSEGMQ